jgi:hypothetical protein
MNLPVRSGILNVVPPSPEPYVVPNDANKSEYVALDIADPSHINHPAGAVDPGYG